MISHKDLFDFNKECLFKALERNLEWAKWTNEIAMQAKKWCIAFWLIYVGFFVKDTTLRITWLQISIGLLGIFFFLVWEVVSHYYGELITQHRFKLNEALALLPKLTTEQLLQPAQLPTSPQYTWSRKKKVRVILLMLGHETLLYFYLGLAALMILVLIAIRYYR